MIELMRQLILSVTAASLFGAVVLSLVPDGAVKEVLRLGTGLVLIFSLVIPLQRYTPTRLAARLPQWETAQTDTQEQLQEAILQEAETQAAAYAETLAEQQGISCTAEVAAEAGEDETAVTSVRLSLNAEADADALAALRQQLCAQFGISDDCVIIQ